MKKIFSCNVFLLLLVVLLVGCSDEANKETKNDSQKDSSTSVSESTTESDSTVESEETTINDSNDVSSENKEDDNNGSNESGTSSESEQNQNNVWKNNDTTEKNDSKIETDKESVKTETTNKQSEPPINREGSDIQNEIINGGLRTDTNIKDQEKAISLVKDYLRSRNELIEDENHFVAYDGQINDYVIVRYSTLLSGHSSTNGRYVVHIKTGEIDPNIF